MPPGSGGGGQPKPPTQPPRVTRASANQELKVNSVDSAREWLCGNGYIGAPASSIDAEVLKLALFQMSRRTDITNEVREGVRAVAFGLECMTARETEKGVTEAVERAMEGYKEALETLAEASVKTIKEMAELVKDRADRDEMEEGQVEEVEGRKERRRTGGVEGGGGPTYAEAVRRAEQEDMVQRARNKARQLLVDFPEGSSAVKDLSERELIAKAAMAKELMGVAGLDAPKVEFISARKLKNGGVLYELNDAEAVSWLAQADVKTLFLEKIGADAKVKDRTYAVFAEFVPTALGDTPEQRLAEIEEANGLQPGELAGARWVRAPHTRTNPAQKVAHLVISCSTDRGANNIIRRGLVVEGKRVQARKMDHEPRRCLKCQKYGKGHLAENCPQEKETCSRCARDHKTKECRVTDPKEFTCVNCKANGMRHDHTSATRTCPIFLEAKARLQNRTPEMKFKYYPTEETWTWARTNDASEFRTASQQRGPYSSTGPGSSLEGITARGEGLGRLARGVMGREGGGARQPTEGGGGAHASPQGSQRPMTQTKLTHFRRSDLTADAPGDQSGTQGADKGHNLLVKSRELDNRIDDLMEELTAHRKELREASPASQ